MIGAASRGVLVWGARLVGAAVLGAALFVWRLSVEPVSLDAFIPDVVEAVGRDSGPRLELGGLELAWSAERSRVDLVVRDVRLITDDGRSRLTLARAAVGLSLKSLLEGRVRPTRLEASKPKASIILHADGSVDLSADETATGGGEATAGALEALTLPPDPNTALGLLRIVDLSDAELTVIDEARNRRTTLRGVTLASERVGDGILGSGRFILDVDGRSATVEVPRLFRASDGSFAATFRVTGADPALPTPWLPEAADWTGRVDAAIDLDLAPDFTPRRWTVDVRAPEFAATIGGVRRVFNDATARLSADRERSTIAVEGLSARMGDLTVTGRGAFDPAARLGEFDGRVGEGVVRLSAAPRGDGVAVDATLDTVDALGIARRVIDTAPLERSPPLSGTVGLALTADGKPISATVDLRVAAGTLSAPGFLPQPMELRSAALVGTFDLKTRTARIERLYLDGDGPTITAAIDASDDGTTVKVGGRFRIERMMLDDLARWWPESVKRNMRRWMTESLSGGVIDEVEIEMNGTAPSDRTDDFDLVGLTGRLSGRDGNVVYLKPLPRVEGVSRIEGEFSGRTLTLRTSGGHIGDVTAGDGRIVVVNLGTPREDIDIQIPLKGPIRTVLETLNVPPFEYPSKLDIDPAKTAGEAEASLHFTFPLFDALRLEDVGIDIGGKLTGAAIAGLAAGRDVTEGALTFQLDTRGIAAKGKVKISGVPATVDWRELFAPTGKDPRTRLGLKGRIDSDALVKLGLGAIPELGGSADLDATLTIDQRRKTRIAGKIDLTKASIAVRTLSIAKAAGEAADARFTVDPPTKRDSPTVIDVKARGEGFDISGILGIGADGRPRFVRSGRIVAGANDFSLELTREGEAYKATLTGAGLDARPMMEDGEDTGDADAPKTPFQATFDLRRVVFGSGRELRTVAGEMKRSASRWETYDVSARTKKGDAVVATLKPDRGGAVLSIKADDAGATLEALDLTNRVRGGALTIDGHRGPGPKDPFLGSLTMIDYRVVDAPGLARLLDAMSLTGMVGLLRGEGLGFARMDADFEYDGRKLIARKLRTAGGALGLTLDGEVDPKRKVIAFQGTIVPIYSVNRILGQIPILGDLLSGGEGQGLFAATWSAKGPIEDPSVMVNPLAVLAPGFLRNLFFLGDEPRTAPN